MSQYSEGEGGKPGTAQNTHSDQIRQLITLQLLEEGGYFDLPLKVGLCKSLVQQDQEPRACTQYCRRHQVAAAQLGLGPTTLKKICREQQLARWPCRQRKSLKKISACTKQAFDGCTSISQSSKSGVLEVWEQQTQQVNFERTAAQAQDCFATKGTVPCCIWATSLTWHKRTASAPCLTIMLVHWAASCLSSHGSSL